MTPMPVEQRDDLAVAQMRRILAGFDPTPACLDWHGAYHQSGYGRIWIGGQGGRNYMTHRLAMCVKEGYRYPDIEGWLVRHQCHNRACFNPEHLLLGDDMQNVLDRVYAGRSKGASGERNGRAKLTDAQVADIRALHEQGHRQVELANVFGVSRMQISRLVNYRERAERTA